MAVYREPSNDEKHAMAYSFFKDVWIHENPVGTLFFISFLMRMHRVTCEDCRHYERST